MSFAQLIKRPHIGWDRAATRRAVSLALAAWLSFAIASQLHLHNAYWAAMPVWAISQPTRGVLLERSIFRVVGTILGAAFGFAIIHLPSSPFIQPVLLALWISLHAGLTHLHRGVHGYGSLLCGITAAIVAIPSIMAPQESMLLALARVDCTLIGVIVGTLVMAFLTPESPMQEFYAHVRSVCAEAVAYAARLLQAGADDIAEEKRLLGTISQLESTARLAAAGSMKGYRCQRYVDLLVVGTLSTLAAAREVCDERQPIAPGVSGQLGRIASICKTLDNQRHSRKGLPLMAEATLRCTSWNLPSTTCWQPTRRSPRPREECQHRSIRDKPGSPRTASGGWPSVPAWPPSLLSF